MVYHVKVSYQHVDVSKPPPTSVVEPICFLSRLLSAAERNYWPTELEVAGLVWVLRKTRHMVQALSPDSPAIVYTDHSATVAIATSTSLKSVAVERLNLRLVRASQYIQSFPIAVYHRSGKSNKIADALSRLPVRSDVVDKMSRRFWPSAGEYLNKSTLKTLARCVSGCELPDEFVTDKTFEGSANESRDVQAGMILGADIRDTTPDCRDALIESMKRL
jgi:hypothetical protein